MSQPNTDIKSLLRECSAELNHLVQDDRATGDTSKVDDLLARIAAYVKSPAHDNSPYGKLLPTVARLIRRHHDFRVVFTSHDRCVLFDHFHAIGVLDKELYDNIRHGKNRELSGDDIAVLDTLVVELLTDAIYVESEGQALTNLSFAKYGNLPHGVVHQIVKGLRLRMAQAQIEADLESALEWCDKPGAKPDGHIKGRILQALNALKVATQDDLQPADFDVKPVNFYKCAVCNQPSGLPSEFGCPCSCHTVHKYCPIRVT
jgi:hypothetical protein